jgi:hypothetical protein
MLECLGGFSAQTLQIKQIPPSWGKGGKGGDLSFKRDFYD